MCWDVENLKSQKKLKGHESFVNSCAPSRRGDDLIVSGSDGMIFLFFRKVSCLFFHQMNILTIILSQYVYKLNTFFD